MPVLFKTKMRMLFSCGSSQISSNIKLLDKFRAARDGNSSQMVPRSCKKRSIQTGDKWLLGTNQVLTNNEFYHKQNNTPHEVQNQIQVALTKHGRSSNKHQNVVMHNKTTW